MTWELENAGENTESYNTATYYKIEFRNTSSEPQVVVIGDSCEEPFVIDNYWRHLPISLLTRWGIKVHIRSSDSNAAKNGLLSYTVAEAYRWAFLAALQSNALHGALCIETRLVAVEFHQTYATKEIGVTPAMEFAFKPAQIAPREVVKR